MQHKAGQARRFRILGGVDPEDGAASTMILAGILTAVFLRGIRTESPAPAADQPGEALPDKLAV